MKKSAYHEKLKSIINLPQFKKIERKRKNEKHPTLKEEERIQTVLKALKKTIKFIRSCMRNFGSQPARLYGLAKVQKKNIPLRPVLSMPAPAYHKVAKKVAEWLSVVPECNINSSTNSVSDSLKNVQLNEDEELFSFDVTSLYTNVLVMGAINICTKKLYDMPDDKKKPPVDRDTFIELTSIAACDVITLTHDSHYKQVDGLAMGSPPAPHLANGWLSQFDDVIRKDAKLFSRYMDDIVREMNTAQINNKFVEINKLDENLKFTMEREEDHSLVHLDMRIIHDKESGKLTSTCYNKPSDTGLIMNYHILVPKRYKRSVVSGFVHRIHRACSTGQHFHESLEEAKCILERNQYHPPTFYEPIVKESLDRIINQPGVEQTLTKTQEKVEKKSLIIQYRGKCTEDSARALHKIEAPCTIIMTLRELKTVFPSLKTPVEKLLRSGVVYKLKCPRCPACYVGQTSRHLQSRFREHLNNQGPMKYHLSQCEVSMKEEDVKILHSTSRGDAYFLTLETLHIQKLKPTINTKDEYRSRTLVPDNQVVVSCLTSEHLSL